MIPRETVANQLYSIYCAAVGGVAFNGDPLPAWETFAHDESKKKQSAAWLAVADHALSLMNAATLPDDGTQKSAFADLSGVPSEEGID